MIRIEFEGRDIFWRVWRIIWLDRASLDSLLRDVSDRYAITAVASTGPTPTARVSSCLGTGCTEHTTRITSSMLLSGMRSEHQKLHAGKLELLLWPLKERRRRLGRPCRADVWLDALYVAIQKASRTHGERVTRMVDDGHVLSISREDALTIATATRAPALARHFYISSAQKKWKMHNHSLQVVSPNAKY